MQNSYFLHPNVQNTGQFSPYQLPSQNYVHNPEIIGDGEVFSLLLPNGSFQYIFVPTLKRDSWPPYALSPNVYNPNWNSNMEAWIIRNVSPVNPLTSYCFNQQLPRTNIDPQIYSSPCGFRFNAPAIEYQNKFHYDQCTSTTDLHYFFPNVRYKPAEKSFPNVQVDTPINNVVYSYEVVCSKPCCCDKQKNEIRTIDQNHKHIDKCMSVDNVREGSETVKSTKIDCQCSSQKLTSDKIMTTYNDQASGENKGLNTNFLMNKTSKTDKTQGMEQTKAYKGIRLRGKNSPIKIIGVCETSQCYCNNTTEEEQ